MTASTCLAELHSKSEPRRVRLLAVLGTVSFFEGYDLNVVMIALPQIRQTFGLTQAQASTWIALLYVGALPAVFFARRADRHGRRRMLLTSVTGYTLATMATALTPGIVMFGICQLCARTFLAVEITLTWTLAAEELPAGARGFGFGILAMLDALGAGAGGLAWGLLLAPHHASWRLLYLAATPVLLIVLLARGRLTEGSRFTSAASAGRLAPSGRPLFRPPYLTPLLTVSAAAVLGNLLTEPSVFVSDFMQTQRHLSPAASNLILVGAGALAIPVLISAGAASDRLGRKPVGCSFLALNVIGALCFFLVARGPLGLFAALAITYIGQFGAWPTLSGFATEMFPTQYRALARSAVGAAAIAGQAGSFLAAATLISLTGSLGASSAILVTGPVLALIIVTSRFPETAGTELHD
jgi:putative MFS transporter